MDENSLPGFSVDESRKLLSDFHKNTHLGFDTNQQYNSTPDPSICNIGTSQREGYDLTSNAALNYINKMLLEEDIHGKCGVYEDEAALHATEKTFYNILGQEYPSPPSKTPLVTPKILEVLGNGSKSSCEQSSNGSNSYLGIDCSPSNQLNHTCDVIPKTELDFQYNKGIEEALKFLPNFDKLFLDSEPGVGALASFKSQKSNHLTENKAKGYELGAKKKLNDPAFDVVEGRAWKQQASSSDDLVRNEKMDELLLSRGEKYVEEVITIREICQKEMKDESEKNCLENLNTTKAGSEKQRDENLVDLRSLLMSCAQAISTNDYIKANEQINQIREHSSPSGDWSQRLAFYFVEGLEARLGGTGSEICRKLASKRITVSNMLKAYRFYLAACPYRRVAFFFSNQTIFNVLENESRIHVIDFGIQFGFQWPSFFERFANWNSTPPKVRITGVDAPASGFRPSELVCQTGKRLTDYAESFNIPFEYKGIASKWENIRGEDLDIRRNEYLVVNCMRSENLTDYSTSMDKDNPRDVVLSTIKKLNPHVFILGVVNSWFNSPYFVSRFREALFHYSSLFDMFDTTLPRDNKERFVMERHLGQRALNAIACEGSERVVRPETYKQWQARVARAGFVPIPLYREMVKTVKDLVKDLYHKEFVVDEDNGWLLMGWKGRILFAMSTWKPNEG